MKFGELKANWAWFLKNMPDDEPCSFPRREVKKRIANKEKKSRIVFVCDPVTFSEFHAEKERVMRMLGENPTLFGVWLVESMKASDDAAVQEWLAEQEGESLADAD